MPTAPEPTCKPCKGPKPYDQTPKASVPKDTTVHRMAAKPAQMKKHENLTLHDWMTVFAYMDKHPHMSQGDVVQNFALRMDGALIFDLSTLSQKFKAWPELGKCIASYPNVLSFKCP